MMKKIFFALLMMFGTYTAFAQNTDKLVNDYIVIKNGLVNSESKTTSTAVLTFQQDLKAAGNFSGKEALVKATEAMTKATTLDKQRAAFNDLSTSLWAVVKGADKLDASFYYQYCPMKKAYWISEAKAIKNPYYGSDMLTCGKVVETK